MKALAVLLVLMASSSVPVLADSVTTSDNLTLFGRIDRFDRTEAKLTARFPSEKGIQTREVIISRGNILRIEFNATTFNPGAPPPGVRPAQTAPAPPTAGGDIIVLRGGQ